MDPLERARHGHHGFVESSFSAWPLVSMLLVSLVLLTLAAVYLWRQGKLALPGAASPEDSAKRILAERFARGDISTEDFMERASILNWTPGNDVLPARPGKKRR